MNAISQTQTPRSEALARPRLALLTLCLAVLVAQVDTAIVNLATRPIGQHFGASIGALQWMVDSYNLVYAVLLLTGGLMADLLGRRRMFVAGICVFTLASLGCALAPSMGVLIAMRALAGVGAALFLPASLAIIRVGWPQEVARGRVLGIWAACNGLAMAIGPALGGWLIQGVGWRSIFFVVIPFGVVALWLSLISIPESADPQGRDVDVGAQFCGALALASLAFAAIELHGAPGVSAVALVVAVAAFMQFLRIERRKGESAMVPLSLFRARAFTGAIVATTAMTFGMYGVLFLLPVTWQGSGQFDAMQAGLALMPMALVFVLASPFSGALTRRLGARGLSFGGVAIIGMGLLVIGLSAGAASIAWAECGLALTGLGMGLATGPLMATGVGAVAAARSGTASALINVARMTGATLGVAGLGAMYSLAHGGAQGLRLALVFAGLVQLGCAQWAWWMTRPEGAARA